MSKRPSLFARGSDTPKEPINGSNGEAGIVDPAIDPATLTTDTAPVGSAPHSSAESSGTTADPITGKRRYRKRGSAQKAETLTVDGLAGILFSGHMMLASLVKAQEFALDDGEAKALALATINVSRHYGTTISAKSMDWANLIMVVGTVYGTRLMTIKMRRNAERQARRAAQQEAKPTHTTVDVNAVPVYDESAFNGAQFG